MPLSKEATQLIDNFYLCGSAFGVRIGGSLPTWQKRFFPVHLPTPAGRSSSPSGLVTTFTDAVRLRSHCHAESRIRARPLRPATTLHAEPHAQVVSHHFFGKCLPHTGRGP